MIQFVKSFPSAMVAVLLGIVGMAATEITAQAQVIPAATAIPVVFTQTIDAATAKPGEVVFAKTTQVVLLPGGQILKKGTALIGHVVESKPFLFNPAPYAVQDPSILSVQFDTVDVNGSTIPVSLSVRAIAGPVAAHEASVLHYRDESDSTGTRELVGGNQFSPIESNVLSADGNVVGYNRGQGVFAHLIAGDSSRGDLAFHCDGTQTEQSVGIFSASACGAYGMGMTSLSFARINEDGTFALKSQFETVKLYANTAALLQVIPA